MNKFWSDNAGVGFSVGSGFLLGCGQLIWGEGVSQGTGEIIFHMNLDSAPYPEMLVIL